MFECPPMNRCRRCIIDHLNGFEHPPCYTCELKMRNIRICVVCFKSIKTNDKFVILVNIVLQNLSPIKN